MDHRIKEIMGTIFEVPADDITDDSSPDSIVLWDSLKHMQLVVALEEEFSVQFSDDEIVGMQKYLLLKEIVTNKMR